MRLSISGAPKDGQCPQLHMLNGSWKPHLILQGLVGCSLTSWLLGWGRLLGLPKAGNAGNCLRSPVKLVLGPREFNFGQGRALSKCIRRFCPLNSSKTRSEPPQHSSHFCFTAFFFFLFSILLSRHQPFRFIFPLLCCEEGAKLPLGELSAEPKPEERKKS